MLDVPELTLRSVELPSVRGDWQALRGSRFSFFGYLEPILGMGPMRVQANPTLFHTVQLENWDVVYGLLVERRGYEASPNARSFIKARC